MVVGGGGHRVAITVRPSTSEGEYGFDGTLVLEGDAIHWLAYALLRVLEEGEGSAADFVNNQRVALE